MGGGVAADGRRLPGNRRWDGLPHAENYPVHMLEWMWYVCKKSR